MEANASSDSYRIRRASRPPKFRGEWQHGVWSEAETARVEHFHPRSSDHRPQTQVKVLYDDAQVFVFFRVRDRYVRAVATDFQGPVHADSCAEFFVQPRPDMGYFNFEMNCGGTLLLYYLEDPRRSAGGFRKYTPVAEHHLQGMRRYHSLPKIVDPEIEEPVEWLLEYSIPLSLFTAHLGVAVGRAGEQWRGNFYKCGDQTSHPHWASWSPIGEALNFHCPEHFGVLELEK